MSPSFEVPEDLPWQPLVELARTASDAILEVYRATDMGVETKADDSPVTAADQAADQIIRDGLERLTPAVPRMTEETEDAPYDERRAWDRYWCVDPLDGTKEFVKRGGEFTVNIGLIENGRPVVGVVHAPVPDITWYGRVGQGAVKIADGRTEPIRVATKREGPLQVVASKSHMNDATRDYLERLPGHELHRYGSSLKICRIADGTADLYPRLGPTMEWDTAAAHAVLEAAGGRLSQIDGSPFRYNKPDLLNPSFVALGPIHLAELLPRPAVHG